MNIDARAGTLTTPSLALSDRQVLALTAWAEARGARSDPYDRSPVEELLAVMCVVRNRRPNFGRWRAADASYKAICLAPAQFSCWNLGNTANHLALLEQVALMQDGDVVLPAQIRECLHLADGVIGGAIIDRTEGSTSYYAPAAMVPPGRVPEWALNAIPIPIGGQLFIKLA